MHGILLALAAVPGLYLLAALLGSLIPVNRGWQEPHRGITIYLADNGIHADIIMPAVAEDLDWRPLVPKRDFASPDGELGYFSKQFDVYDREGDPCTNCRGTVKRIVQGGRSTFFCPSCQR